MKSSYRRSSVCATDHRRSAGRVLVHILALVTIAGLGLAALGCGSTTNSGSGSSPSASASGKTTTVAAIAITSDPSLTAMLPSSLQSSGVLRVGTNMPYAPWEYYVSEGSKQATGLDYDLSGALAAKLGIQRSFDQNSFDSLIPALLASKEDAVMAEMEDTQERQKVLDFVDYAQGTSLLVVAKGNPANITTLNDLSGKDVAMQSGNQQSIFIQKQLKAAGLPAAKIHAFPSQTDILLAIESGKAVATMMEGPAADQAVKQFGKGNALEVVEDPASPDGYSRGIIGIGIRKGNTQLVNALQKALQALMDDGTYAKIFDKYGMPHEKVTKAEVDHALH
jgi:polar amino acid transport system substrate-binding protein